LADLITRLRNANKAKHEKVDVPASNLKVHVARILKMRDTSRITKSQDENRAS